MSSIELKPCPFCGGEARMMKVGYPHWVYCRNCGARVYPEYLDWVQTDEGKQYLEGGSKYREVT